MNLNDNIIKRLQLAVIGFAAYKKYKLERKKNKRRYWIHPMWQSRSTIGFFVTIYPKIKADPEKFYLYTRMDLASFKLLLTLLNPLLTKSSQREVLNPEFRLLLTIIYLAHGGPRIIYCSKFQIAESTLRKVIYETCSAIWEELSCVYLSPPNEAEYLRIAKDYERKSQLPHCVGAIDGKHIQIFCPRKSGSQYYNYKGNFSIVLLASCDAKYTFTMVDIGAFGSQSDGSTLRSGNIGKLLLRKKLPLPQSAQLPGTQIVLPFYFVGDAAFPLCTNLMRPYPGQMLSPAKTNFNERLSSARITIEQTFGIMAQRWRLVLNKIHAYPDKVVVMMRAIIVLHNFLMLKDTKYHVLPDIDSIQRSYDSLNSARLTTSNNSTKTALNIRETLCNYLNNFGL